MLTKLKISNYALIENSEIEFTNGLNIITGETGAGKSILLGALSLLMGQRADNSMIFEKDKKCIVEGEFNISNYSLKEFLDTNGLDYQETTFIRREILSNGTSRAFINDTPVNLNLLKEFSSFLIDIHSQHQNLEIGSGDFQFNILDALALNKNLLDSYKEKFKTFKNLKNKLTQLTEAEINGRKELDFIQFQFNELEEANLDKINQPELENELESLNNAESIKQALSGAWQILSENEFNVIQQLNAIKPLLAKFSGINKNIQEVVNRLNSAIVDLKDLANEIESIEGDIVYNPSRIEIINETLDKLYRLQKKHHVNNINELIEVKNNLSESLEKFNSLENQIKETELEIIKTEKELNTIAAALETNRKKAIPEFEKKVHELMALLNMPNAKFKIELTTVSEFNNYGKNNIAFLFTANKGGELAELNKVASGGELSRLMLCIKSIVAQSKQLPSIIFDEIDTGVSGDVADKIGQILNTMGNRMQVTAITHLPQLASKGKQHLFVYKQDLENRTISKIKKLNSNERIEEIAKMLSTGKPTEAAINNAKELLSIN